MRRFAQGLPVAGQNTPLYDIPEGQDEESERYPDPRRMDLAEIEEELLATKERMEATRRDADRYKAEYANMPEKAREAQKRADLKLEAEIDRQAKILRRARKRAENADLE